MASFATDELLTLPKETLPTGEMQRVLNTIGVLYVNTIDVLSAICVTDTLRILDIIGVRNTIGLLNVASD